MNLYSIPIFWVYFFRMGVKFYQNHFLIIWYDHVVLLLKLIWWNTLMDLWKLISGVPLEYISLGHNVWCFHILLSLLANILIKIVVFILWFRYHGGSSQPRDWTQIIAKSFFTIADSFFTIWATREALVILTSYNK